MNDSRTPAMQPDQHLEHLRSEVGAYLDVLATGDLAAKVPSCPDWSLHDLSDHTGWIYRWADQKISGAKRADIADAPRDREALTQWFAASADIISTRLAGVTPETPCWTFNEAGFVRFWMRRMALETALHRWDAQLSQGEPGPIDPLLAFDGVDEVVSMYFPRQVRLGRIAPLRRTLAINITGRTTPGDRFVLVAESAPIGAAPEAEISGPPETILLLLWQRITLDDDRVNVDVTGSPAAAREVLATDLTP